MPIASQAKEGEVSAKGWKWKYWLIDNLYDFAYQIS